MKIGRKSMSFASAIAFAAAAAPPATQQKVTGPVAVYWMSAATTSGFGFGGMGSGGGKPSMGDIMSMMRGGNRATHLLDLRLGSSMKAAAPEANHLPGTANPLLLLTPVKAPPAPVSEETTETQPEIKERPKGKILLYWGCGEHAGAGQPVVLDFSKMLEGGQIPKLPFVSINHQNPPSAGRYATYGEWPNTKARQQQPPASLLGDHQVKGNYSPDIKFTLPPGKDYMPPIALNASAKSPAGATILQWQAVTGATGYFTTLFGASGQGGDEGSTIVMWSSSAVSTFAGGGLLDYLAPAEVRRLIGQKLVMPPTQTQCMVPAEVTAAAKSGIVSMIAYGDEANFADPPRPADPKVPWNISWTTKVRYKSTTGLILGMQNQAAAPGSDEPYEGRNARQQQQQNQDQQQQPKKKGGLFDKLKGAVSPF